MRLNIPYAPAMTPGGPRGPLYWANEQTGLLATAVKAYLDWACGAAPEPCPEDLEIFIGYCEYWVNAPCWRGEAVAELALEVGQIKTAVQIRDWIHRALEFGIDPL